MGQTIFTLSLESHICETTDVVQILFNVLWKKALGNNNKFFDWLFLIINQISKANPSNFTGHTMEKMIKMVENAINSAKKTDEPLANKKKLKQRSKKKIETQCSVSRLVWEEFFKHIDKDGNDVLKILAKHKMDEPLMQMLTNDITKEYITHSVLTRRNNIDQTLMSMIEVHGQEMSDSLPVLVKLEYACHAYDLTNTEMCLSGQLETSVFTFEVIKALRRFEPMTWCEKFQIFMSLFIPHLLLNIGLTVKDWYWDGYLANHYWKEWGNETRTDNFDRICSSTINNYKDEGGSNVWDDMCSNITTQFMWVARVGTLTYNNGTTCIDCYDPNDPLKPYENCTSAEMKFYYTLIPIIAPVVLYFIEFFVLSEAYEPTGLRNKIIDTWRLILGNGKYVLVNKEQTNENHHTLKEEIVFEKPTVMLRVMSVLWLLIYLFFTVLAIICWMPVSATCKFIADYKYETSTGDKKLWLRRRKKHMDLSASRGEQMEVSIEDVFEPMIQGYIVFPSIISLGKRLSEGISYEPTDPNDKSDYGVINQKLHIDIELETVEIAQMMSIITSAFCLAWCYSEYHSVKKNLYMDITTSPFSRLVMLVYMLLQIFSRLFAFMLFTLFWGPGNYYPLMVFVAVHMAIAAILHVVFSDDINLLPKGKYVKFFHNVLFNSFASIYFHNYIHQDESSDVKRIGGNKVEKESKGNSKKELECDDGKRGTYHSSTLLRQISFDVLYVIEGAVLLICGLLSEPLYDKRNSIYCHHGTVVTYILVFFGAAYGLRILYYIGMHVWSDVILYSKWIQVEERNWFIRYFIICRNTWIWGKLKHVKITILVVPRTIHAELKAFKESMGRTISKLKDQLKIWLETTTCSCPIIFYRFIQITISFVFFLPLFLILNVLAFTLLLIVVIVLLIPLWIINLFFYTECSVKSLDFI